MRSRQPLFLQAAGQLRLKIESGEWGVGCQLPALDALQAEFGLSRATIREALDLLEKEGMILRRRGRGTFVRPELKARRTHALPSRWETLLESLEEIRPELVAPIREEAGAELRNLLAGTAEGAFVRLRRVHSHSAEPYCLIDIHVRKAFFDAHREAILAGPVIRVLAGSREAGLDRVLQRVTFSSADDVTASALGVALGAPVVEILRTLVDRDGRVLAHTYARYPGEYVRLDFEFDPGGAAAGPREDGE
jgi:GntR family transcriptional regulator